MNLPDFVEAWIDGQATPEEAERLQAWLREDREHPRALMRAMRLHQALREGHQGAAEPKQQRQRKPSLRLAPKRRRPTMSWAPLAAAAALAIAGLIWLLSGHVVAPRADDVLARVVAVDGLGAMIGDRELKLGAGVASGAAIVVPDGGRVAVSYDDGTRIEFSHGARVSLVQVDGSKEITIDDGVVTGSIAKQAEGRPMRWRSREAIATIVGTILTLDARAETRLEVVEGRVRFERTRDRAVVEVAAGEYARTSDAVLAAKRLHEQETEWAWYWQRWPRSPFGRADSFPIAVWSQDPVHAPTYAKLGVNLYLALWQGPTEAQLAQLKAAGMATICEQNQVGLQHLDDPTIVGWFLDEGPDNAKDGKRGRTTASLQDQYRKWSKADPSRPIACNFGPGAAITDWFGRGEDTGHVELYPWYLQATDIASFDLYPVANCADPKAAGQLWRIADGVDHLRDWARHAEPRGKPVWAMIETGQIKDDGPRPTREQVRAEAWMAIIHGASGICWFCHRFGPGDHVDPAALLHDGEASAAVAAIDAEIARFANALNAPTASGATVTSSDREAPLEVLAKPLPHGLFVAAVAMRDHGTTATIRLPFASGTVEVVGEARSLTVAGGSFQDSFGPYGVHLYQATPAGP